MAIQLHRTADVVKEGIHQGLHLGAQIHVVLRGQSSSVCIGDTRRNIPVTADTVLPWFSAGKPIGAVAIAQLVERGRASFEDRVAQHLPKFAQNGKDAVTIRHLLTHTCGFRMFNLDTSKSTSQQLEAICAAPLERGWIPGQKAGYHPRPSWIILGEIIRRVDGREYGEYARQEILLPLGMVDSWFGIAADQCRAYGERLGTMYNTSKAPPNPDEPPPSEPVCAQATPGAGLRSTSRDMQRFYQLLLASVKNGAGNPPQVLSQESIRNLVARHRVDMHDHTFGTIMDWGLGFLLNRPSDRPLPYGYGKHASMATFGHSGAESSSAFCDPDHELIVAWVCNGMPGDARHQARQHAINTAIYEDLRIA